MSTPATAPVAVFGDVALGKMVTQKSNPEEGREAHYLRAAHVQPFGQIDLSVSEKTMWFSDHEIERLTLELGDVVIVEGGAGYGRTAVVPDSFEGWGFQNSIVRVRPNPVIACGRYLSYALQMSLDQGLIELEASTATIPHFTAEKVSRFRVPIHPAPTQRAIADYLDRETAEIDAMATDLDELGQELRTRLDSTIRDKVFGGVATAGSASPREGLWWAGQVNEDFPVANIRSVAEMKTGHTPSRANGDYWKNVSIPWMTLGDVHQLRAGVKYVETTTEKISELGLANSAADLLPPGTVLLSRTASVGFTGITATAMATSQDYWNWIPGPNLISEYLWYQFRAMFYYFKSLTFGSTHKTVYQADAASLRVVVPPLDDQRRIVEHLDKVTAEIDSMIADAQELKALLAERRSALITEVVTGRKEVPVS